MVEEEPWMFHSMLSSSLNLKLLNPKECLDKVIARVDKIEALNSIEGFVRQILGWREFIRGVYWSQGPGYAERNFLGESGDLPELYWTGDTEMNCMKQCLKSVVDHGFGHHIQRLMVTGNFALISGVHPKKISDWYLGMYIDAIEWVTLPNTLGMVMHADGGIVGTKPYAAGGNYISKMSNYCKNCKYNPSEKYSDDACPFSVLYWDFMFRHKDTLSDNQRMSLILNQVNKYSDEDKKRIQSKAKKFKKEYGIIK
jgi:deoxyribodipyrimidine photolyase-related protein